MVKRSDQMKIIDIILKKNRNISAGQGAKAYKVLKKMFKDMKDV